MANHRLFDDFQKRLGETVSQSDNDFANSVIKEAEDFILNYTMRETLPERLDSATILLAVTAWNKRGAEGESSRSEGGISRVFDDLPVTVRESIKMFRKVGTVL